MKYLFSVKEFFPPFRVDTTVLFGDELVAMGHDIVWLFESEDLEFPSGKSEWLGGVAIVKYTGHGKSALSRIFRNFRSIFLDMAMVPIALREKWDFIQVRDRVLGGLVGLVMARLTQTPYFYWLSFPYPELYSRRLAEGESRYPTIDRIRANVMQYFLYKVICRYSDHIFVQSDQMKADLEAKGVKPSLMTPVPMCISLDRVEEFKRSHKAKKSSGKVTLLYLGTLARARKLDFLIRVLSLVKEKRKDVTLLFVGAGNVAEDERLLLAEAKKFGLEDSVNITGFLPWEEAWQLVLDSDICLSPYYPTPILNSTSPTKLIEYLALEKPVVANDHPDQRRVIESSNAGICVPWEEQAFADAIISLLENPEMAQGMASNGFSYVRDNRSYEFMGKFLAETYNELLAKK